MLSGLAAKTPPPGPEPALTSVVATAEGARYMNLNTVAESQKVGLDNDSADDSKEVTTTGLAAIAA